MVNMTRAFTCIATVLFSCIQMTWGFVPADPVNTGVTRWRVLPRISLVLKRSSLNYPL